VFEPAIMTFIPDDRPSDFGFDVFPAALRAGEAIYGYEMGPGEGLWWIDTPEHHARVTALWRDGFPGA
jgi:NDP-sugar pyrophosphorylase family protein